jgi:hypothetical protein
MVPFALGALLSILSVPLHELGHLIAISLTAGSDAIFAVHFASVEFMYSKDISTAEEIFIYSAGVGTVMVVGYLSTLLFWVCRKRSGVARELSFLGAFCFLILGTASVFEDLFFLHGDLHYIFLHLDTTVPFVFILLAFFNLSLVVRAVRIHEATEKCYSQEKAKQALIRYVNSLYEYEQDLIREQKK